jgi:hypothetical protein
MAASLRGSVLAYDAPAMSDEMAARLENGFHAGYVVPVLAGLLLAALFPSSRGIADPEIGRAHV